MHSSQLFPSEKFFEKTNRVDMGSKVLSLLNKVVVRLNVLYNSMNKHKYCALESLHLKCLIRSKWRFPWMKINMN